MTSDETVERCRKWQEAWVHRDSVALSDCYAETAVLDSPMAGSALGREAVVKATETLFAAFPDMAVTMEPPLVDGDRVATVAEAVGTHVGSFMGLPPSSKAFRFRLVFLLDFLDGRIARDRRMYDSTGLLIQLGVLKAKPL